MNLFSVELTDRQFQKVSGLVYKLSGIHLKPGKEALVRARLMKRLRTLKIKDFDTYIKYIESDAGIHELGFMVDVMTTNKTSFFRETEHFNFLKNTILPELSEKRLRFWTAASSSGEEPYSLAIQLRESLPDIDLRDVKILATDISMQMLEKAKNAIYGEETIKVISPQLILKYFKKIENTSPQLYQVKDSVRSMVRLAWLNLMDRWPMKGPFNVIFCRNVMIYFDRQTQQRLINRLYDMLESNGYLFVGHSEGLSAISHRFKYIKPAIYKKVMQKLGDDFE